MADFDFSQEREVYEFVAGNSIYIYLLLVLIYRKSSFKEIANVRKRNLSQTLIIKIFLTLLLICTYISMIITSFFTNEMNFWLSRNNLLSLIFLFPIGVLIIQIYILRSEYLRKLPLIWYIHNLFWILITICHTFFFFNTFVQVLKLIL